MRATQIGSVSSNAHNQNNEQVSFCIEKNINNLTKLGETK
jgi:hypothetical protein